MQMTLTMIGLAILRCNRRLVYNFAEKTAVLELHLIAAMLWAGRGLSRRFCLSLGNRSLRAQPVIIMWRAPRQFCIYRTNNVGIRSCDHRECRCRKQGAERRVQS